MSNTPFDSQEEEDIYGFPLTEPFSLPLPRPNIDTESLAPPSFTVTSSWNSLRPSVSFTSRVIRISEHDEESHEQLKQYKVLPSSTKGHTNGSYQITSLECMTGVCGQSCGRTFTKPSILRKRSQSLNANIAPNLFNILFLWGNMQPDLAPSEEEPALPLE